MITKEEKDKIIKDSQVHKKDTGSADVQVSLLSENINKVLEHLKEHSRDLHTRRGLLKMVIKRKRLLGYLKKKDPKRYEELAKKLNFKK